MSLSYLENERIIAVIALFLILISSVVPWFTIRVLFIDYPLSLWEFYQWGGAKFESLPTETLITPIGFVLAIIAGLVGVLTKSPGTRKDAMQWAGLLGLISTLVFYALVSEMAYVVTFMGTTITLRPWRIDIGFWLCLFGSFLMFVPLILSKTRACYMVRPRVAERVHCAFCGTSNVKDAVYCKECGRKIAKQR